MANHIKNLQIDTFRGIQKLVIDDIGDVNIFVGDNNTGKTSVLEAIQILCEPDEYNLVQISRRRERYRASIRMGLSAMDSILYLFDVNTKYKDDNFYKINISGIIDEALVDVSIKGNIVKQIVDLNEIAKYSYVAKNRLNHSVVEGQEEIPTFVGEISSGVDGRTENRSNNNQKRHFEVNEFFRMMRNNNQDKILNYKSVQTIDHIIENAFNKLIKNKEIKEQAVELLKEFDTNITDIRYINDEGRFVPVIESNNSNEYIPLSLYGDGMKKALTMLNAMLDAESGVVLIDEFETALHTTAMNKVFKFILDLAYQLNVQVFLTTHSLEAVDKLLKSSGEYIENVRVIRLKKKEGITLAKVLKGNEALNDRKEYNMELRI